MAIERQLDSEHQPSSETISEAASDWLYQFIKHFELNFIDVSRKLPADIDRLALQRFTLEAVFDTIEDSGLSREEMLALLADVASRSSAEPVNWTAELNARRYELIDKQISGTFSSEERMELTSLTQAMRRAIETEANLPMEGARELHQKLQQLRARDQELRRHPR
jgi:hypothetical protein